MQIQLTRPELAKFIDEQVKSGLYPTPDAAIEAAVERMMHASTDELDDGTIDAINRAEEQLDRGEGIEFREFAAKMRQKFPR